jgi:predicted permease
MNLWTKLLSLFRRNRLETEMAEELRAHLDLQIERNVAAGMSVEQARREARRAFGGQVQIEERCRDERAGVWIEHLARDVRQAVRQLRRRPGFTVVAVITLALGIGANTAMFSIVQAVMLKPLPLGDPERLVQIWETNPERNVPFFSVSVPNFLDWRERAQSFETLAAVTVRSGNVRGRGEPEALGVHYVSAEFPTLLGLPILHGRGFLAEEDQPGRNRVVILNELYWRIRYGSDPAAVGQSLVVDGHPHTIVGVLAKGLSMSGPMELLVPLGADLAREERDNREMDVYGRLRAGVTVAQAEAELQRVAAQIWQDNPGFDAGWTVRLLPLSRAVVNDQTRRMLWLLLGAVGLLLLIACANLSNLLLARAAVRLREMAVRAALGGPRRRLISQLLTESVVLAALGGVAGVLVGYSAIIAFRASSAAQIVPRGAEVTLDLRVLAFTAVVAMTAGVLAGLAPALRGARVDLRSAFSTGSRQVAEGRNRLRQLLVVAQLGLSFVLLAGAGLLLQSFYRLTQVDLGFNPTGLLTLRLAPRDDKSAFYDRLMERVAALPGVTSVGLTNGVPLIPFNTSLNVFPVGPARIPNTESVQADWRVIRGDYFETLGVPVLRGRTFDAADNNDAPKRLIVNETLARQIWGDEDPIGRQLIAGRGDDAGTVIGVVADARTRNAAVAPAPAFYFSGYRWLWGHMTLVVRTSGDPHALVPAIRQEVKALNPELPISFVRTMEEHLADSLGQPRLLAGLVAGFSLLALILAAVGVYGVMAFAVAQRTQEIGIRLALGAQVGQVLRMILRDGGRLAAWGLAFGLIGAVVVAQSFESMLFETEAVDPTTLLAAGGLLMLVAVIASLVPARRATKVDPIVALRAE